MSKQRILVIEDDEDVQELIRFVLHREGYVVSAAATGEAGIRLAKARPPALVVLDRLLPGLDGIEVCRALRSDPGTAGLRILMVSAKAEESDIVSGLEVGADDYLTKPFSPRVLVARARALLRPRLSEAPGGTPPIQVHDLLIHPGRHEVLVRGHKVMLSFTEFEFLKVLAERPGWTLSRTQIVYAVRGEDYPVTDRSVDAQMVGLRKKLGPYGSCIETVRGVGYRLRRA